MGAKMVKPQTDRPLWEIIAELRRVLGKEYGTDFAFSILGKGKLIAASNMRDGLVLAPGEGDPEGKNKPFAQGA